MRLAEFRFAGSLDCAHLGRQEHYDAATGLRTGRCRHTWGAGCQGGSTPAVADCPPTYRALISIETVPIEVPSVIRRVSSLGEVISMNIEDLRKEPTDEHTFLAAWSFLDRLDFVSEDDAVVAIAQELVLQIPPHRCRLPHWPSTPEGHSIASSSSGWLVVRSLGFEGFGEHDWTQRLRSSFVDKPFPHTMAELAITVDDLVQFRRILNFTELTTLSIEPNCHGNVRDFLEPICATVRQLFWRASPDSLLDEKVKLGDQLRSYDSQSAGIKTFQRLLEDIPEGLEELGPCILLGEPHDKVQAICTTTKFARQMTRLDLPCEITDTDARNLAKGQFSALVQLGMRLRQPSDIPGELFTEAGAGAVSRAVWWTQLKNLSLRNVYCDEVLVQSTGRQDRCQR